MILASRHSSLLAVALLLLLPAVCAAQTDEEVAEAQAEAEEPGLGGKGYLGLDTLVFATTSAKVETTTVGPLGTPITSSSEMTTTQFGLGSPALGFGLGYAPDDFISIGVRLAFESATAKIGSTEVTSKSVGFAPNVKVMLIQSGSGLPYVMATFGYKNVSTEAGSTTQPASQSASVDGLSYGGALGILLFPNPYVSFEPSVGLQWQTIKVGGASDTATSMTGYIGLSLSAWFGSEDEPEADASEAAPQRHQEAPAIEPTSGKMDVSVRRRNGHKLRITIDPDDDTPQFSLALTIPSEATRCETLQLVGAKGEVSLPAEQDESLDKRTRIVSATAPYQALKLWINQDKADIAACNTIWRLNAPERQRLLKMMSIFRARARRAGSFEAARAVPLPGSTEPTSMPETPSTESAPED